ncbi:hypothetical protein ABZU32_39060 [Sphaerisporangium sp. NPDC005288]|uniref:hypothetical protein n=1 Tax=Sphaerisporangium sp. NPDC005288 TaxID=3155114 RepID=UPI0033B02305
MSSKPGTTRTRVRSAGGEKTVGRLVLAVLASWGVYVALDRFTVAPDAFAYWVSGAAAALALTVRTGRR